MYIRTEKNILIEVNPQTRIPRTFKRFAGLMGKIQHKKRIPGRLILFLVQLLHRFKVRASDGSMKLLKVIKNPITDHLPVGCPKISTSFSAKRVVKPLELVPKGNDPIVIVIGAMAHGAVNFLQKNQKTYIICMNRFLRITLKTS